MSRLVSRCSNPTLGLQLSGPIPEVIFKTRADHRNTHLRPGLTRINTFTSIKRELRALYKPKARNSREAKNKGFRHEIRDSQDWLRPDTAGSKVSGVSNVSALQAPMSSEINIFEALNSPPLERLREKSEKTKRPENPRLLTLENRNKEATRHSEAGSPICQLMEQRHSKQEAENINQTMPEGQDNETEPVQVLTPEEAQELREATYIRYAGEDESDYAKGRPRLVLASDGVEDCGAILLTLELSSKIQKAVRKQRAFVRADTLGMSQRQALMKLEVKIDREISSRSSRLLMYEEEGEGGKDGQAALQQQRELLELLKADVQGRRSAIVADLASKAESLRETQAAANALIEEAFVSGQLVESESSAPLEAVEELVLEIEYENFCQQLRGAFDDEAHPTSPPPPPLVISRSHLHAPAPSAEDSARQVLVDTLWRAKERLELARQDFERRESVREEEKAANMAAARLGQRTTDDSPEAFDVRWVARYRELTRALIDAEAGFTAARVRALEAGVEVAFDDQSSVFGDGEFESGYQMGQEGEVGDRAAPQSPGKVGRWLEAVPEDAVGDFVGASGEGEAEEWEAREVGISDSISVVAQGNERSRIDGWKEVVGLPGDGGEKGLSEE